MARTMTIAAVFASLLTIGSIVRAQEDTGGESGVKDQAKQVVDDAQKQIGVIAEQVDQSEKAREVSAGILAPIYNLAETFSFPAFHWVAFAVMVAGTLSFGLQLVLAKLVVLSKLSLSLTEILSDALGFVVSLVGLVLTTQAAAENSSFAASPFAVISATAVGGIAGFVFYLWGQRQELQAVKGRSKVVAKSS